MRVNAKLVLFALAAVIAAIVSAQDVECGCEDTPPPHAPTQFTCEQQDTWEKCNEEWMVGYCKCTCGTCEEAPFSEDMIDSGDMVEEEEVTTGGGAVVVETEVLPGEPSNPGVCGDIEEPRNCKFSRQRCCSSCTSETEVDFECNQIGNSFASSCSCAGGRSRASGRAVSQTSTSS